MNLDGEVDCCFLYGDDLLIAKENSSLWRSPSRGNLTVVAVMERDLLSMVVMKGDGLIAKE